MTQNNEKIPFLLGFFQLLIEYVIVLFYYVLTIITDFYYARQNIHQFGWCV
jgi:hypothetical protein